MTRERDPRRATLNRIAATAEELAIEISGLADAYRGQFFELDEAEQQSEAGKYLEQLADFCDDMDGLLYTVAADIYAFWKTKGRGHE